MSRNHTRNRLSFESRLKYGFSSVRLRTDEKADQSNRVIRVQAFTFRQYIVLGAGQRQPGVLTEKRLVAYELVYMIQQRGMYSNHAPFQITEGQEWSQVL
jgi:hypothetical protein